MSEQFFTLQGNHESGPFTLSELNRLRRFGSLRPSDLIRKSRNRDEWFPAGRLPGLFGHSLEWREAICMAGPRPLRPDLQDNYWEDVTELYKELRSDIEEGDAFVGRRRFSTAANKTTRPKPQPQIDSSQKSVQTTSTILEKCDSAEVIDDMVPQVRDLDDLNHLLPPPHKPAEGISTGPSIGNAAWVPDAEDRMLWEAFYGLPYGADSVPLIDSETPPLAHRTINDQSEFKIAHRFITGSVVEDHAKGMEILLALAEKGHTDSQRLLGLILWFGTIVPKNCESASKWFRKAADAGDGWSMQRLGVMLLDGDGIERNETEAFRWFQLAANLGIDEAMNCLAMCFLRGRGTEKDGDKAIHWLKVASELECEVAQYNLGRRYFLGEFVERDYEKALSLFKLASRWDDKEATPSEWYIYCCYKEGCGTVPDLKTAVEWLQKGASRECPMSMAELGRIYMRGECVDRDFTKGTQLLQKAAISGDAHAQFHLGIAYQNGDGVPRDEGEAIRWFYLASKNRSEDTDGFVLGNELAVSHLWDMISPLISDRLRFSLG